MFYDPKKKGKIILTHYWIVLLIVGGILYMLYTKLDQHARYCTTILPPFYHHDCGLNHHVCRLMQQHFWWFNSLNMFKLCLTSIFWEIEVIEAAFSWHFLRYFPCFRYPTRIYTVKKDCGVPAQPPVGWADGVATKGASWVSAGWATDAADFTAQDLQLGFQIWIQQYQIRIYQQLVYLWLKHTPLGFHHQRSEFEINYLTKGHWFGSVSKPCTPVVHIKIAGLKWMWITH